MIIRIPTPLRAYTKDQDEVSVNGQTVGECLSELCTQHPDLPERIMDSHGQLRHFVNVYLNDTNIKSLQTMDTPTTQTDVLSIIPAVAGG